MVEASGVEPSQAHVKRTSPISKTDVEMVTKGQENDKLKAVYPKAEEELIDFLNRCKLSNSEVMLCPRCSAVFDKEAAKELEAFRPQMKRKGKWVDKRPKFDFADRRIPYVGKGKLSTYVPPSGTPAEKWVHSGGKGKGLYHTGGNIIHRIRPNVMAKGSVNAANQNKATENKKFAYNNNYKGKNPMTRTQWRRFQRQKKADAVATSKGANPRKEKGKEIVLPSTEVVRKPATERIFPSLAEIKKSFKEEDLKLEEELNSSFADSEHDFDVLCGVVSILPIEYDIVSEVNEVEEEIDEGMAYKPICYYVLKNGCVEEQQAVFERPDCGMMNHLKPLFIQAKVNNVGVNKVLVDGGAAVNLMPQHLLSRIGKYDTDLRPHNVVLTNYEGKSGYSLGAIQVELAVGSIKRPTLFMVIPSKANYNLLLGREWIHAVGAIPSTVHQRLVIWREDGLVENIEGDQSYFKAEVNAITKQTFDKQLANIAPCSSANAGFTEQSNVISSVNLHPNYGFIWERHYIDDGNATRGFDKPSGWDD